MIQIACGADANYVPYCATMLHGLLRRHPRCRVHFMHGPELGAETLDPLAGMVTGLGGEFSSHLVGVERIHGLPTVTYVSQAMWYRTALPELLPDEPRVLYLDCDTFVVDDLQSLWELDLGDNYLAAVEGVPAPGAEDWPRDLGVGTGNGYFNSGVLLLNLDALRAGGMTARLVEFGRAHADRVRWPDQDALNIVLGDKRLALHPRWNCQGALFTARSRALEAFDAREIDEATANPAILHFEGPGDCKPWHFLSSHPWAAEYRRTLASTPWRDTPLRARTWRNRFIAATLPAGWRIPVYARIEQYKHRLGLPSDIG